MELRILKDLAAIPGEIEIDCKEVSESHEDKFLDLRILKELGGQRDRGPIEGERDREGGTPPSRWKESTTNCVR